MDKKDTSTTEDLSKSNAVALIYKEDDLPRVVAKGRGAIAERIKAIAKEAEVPIHQDANLSNALSSLELDQPIPRELFAAVAQVLVFAYSLSNKKPPSH